MKYTLAIAALIATAAAEGEKTPEKKKETPAAPACALTKFALYKEKDCKTELKLEGDDKAAADAFKKVVAENLGCKDDKKVKLTCDGTGITTETFEKDKCTGTSQSKAVSAWDKCTETVKGSGYWVKVTGAKALMASATIALAFVGSQF